MNENKTLGEVIREMVKRALESDDKTFGVSVSAISDLIGASDGEIPKLKSSYIYNTTGRMVELRDSGLKATYHFDDDGGDNDFGLTELAGDRKLVIKLVPGSVNIGTRKKNQAAAEAAVIEKFKGRLLAVTPSIVHLKGEELQGAMFALSAYQELIKETN